MRKLKLQMQMSLDGFVATGPNDEQHWVTWALDEIHADVLELLNSIDTILIGRKLAIDYIPFWQEVATKPDHPMYAFATRIVDAKKIVFTKTLQKSAWENTELATGDLVETVRQLKNQEGKDMIVYGGSSFVSSLVKEGLIDEFNFFINPVVLGKGDAIFTELDAYKQLHRKKSIVYDCGIVMLSYDLTNEWKQVSVTN